MKILKTIGGMLADAFRTNLRFLLDSAPEARNRDLLKSEMRDLIGRDLDILVHKRTKSGDAAGEMRWSRELDSFVSGSLRPRLAGSSLLALWNDGALMRMLDAVVANEQELVAVRARSSQSLPVTSRFDSPWAS
jgi:hypothetical protein